MRLDRPVHYLSAVVDPQRAVAILVPGPDRVELAEFDLADSVVLARAVIDLDESKGNTPVLMHLVARGFLRLADLIAAAESVAAGVPVRDMPEGEQDILHLIFNLQQARREFLGFDA